MLRKTQKRIAVAALFLCVILAAVAVVHAQNHDAPHSKIIGKIQIGKNEGFVAIQMMRNQVMLQLGLNPNPTIEATNFSGWILTADGETLPYKKKEPESGEPYIGIDRSGTDIKYIFITFQRVTNKAPTAVVIKIGGEYQIFSFPKFEMPSKVKRD